MFSIRIKQLERRLSDYDYGGAEAPEELVSELKRLYNILDQVNVLGQIFSRNVSQLAVEEVSEEILKKIKILIHLGQLVLIKISDETCGTSFPIDDYSNLKIDKKEFKFIQNDLRSMKKNKNKSITNFERFIDYLISNVDNRYNKIKSISNFDGLLEHVFGVKLDDGSCEPNEIENINVKELLLMNQLS